MAIIHEKKDLLRMNTFQNELSLHLALVQIFMVKCGEWGGIMFIFLLIDFKSKKKLRKRENLNKKTPDRPAPKGSHV